MRRPAYEAEKCKFQVELLELQAWVQETSGRVVILFEGRDAVGKGATIKRFTERLNPRGGDNRAGVGCVMGCCADAEYREFMLHGPEFERQRVRRGTHVSRSGSLQSGQAVSVLQGTPSA